MGDLPVGAWDILGIVLFGVLGYLLLVRVIIPRFGNLRVSSGRRKEATARAEKLLEDGSIDEETRHRLQRCLNTLRSSNARTEGWAGQVPVSEIVDEIDSIWEEREPNQT